jgi:hypothetical protein
MLGGTSAKKPGGRDVERNKKLIKGLFYREDAKNAKNNLGFLKNQIRSENHDSIRSFLANFAS